MGIQLDWQVESEQARQTATEDPNSKFSRRRRRRRMLAGMILLGLLVFAVIFVVTWRLKQVENRIESDLRDTVEVELAALRIGNYNNFMMVQRSASDEWIEGQQTLFVDYQQLKQEGLLGTDDRIVDVNIDPDQPRARVVIEQIIGGEPYRLVWFYWRYNDVDGDQNGWRHVPPDIEFWGDRHTISRESVAVTYRDLDKALAEALAPMIENWWQSGCDALGCPVQEKLMVSIVPQTLPGPMWDLYEPYTLLVPSPLVDGRASYGQLPSPELQAMLQEMISERLITMSAGIDFSPSPYTDTFWLYGELIAELQASFGNGSGSVFFNALQALYGADIVEQFIGYFGPGADIGTLQNVVNPGVQIPDLPDEELNNWAWAEFFQWRLRAEQVAQGADPDSFRNLYDTSDGNALAVAQQRFENRDASSPIPRVLDVTIARDEFGRRIANVLVLPDPGDENVQVTIVFRWTATTWKRIT